MTNNKPASRKIAVIIAAAVVLALAVTAVLFYNGVILFNNPYPDEYPVRGVDVSAYQGDIDWETLAAEDISFAFIKATEGSGFTDRYFAENYKNAIETELRVGAYHFFSFDSAGATQAENFINSVYAYDDMLPPVVDVEYYGDYLSDPPDHVDEIRAELRVFIDALTEEYGMTPIIYATEESCDHLLAEGFSDCGLWIRNVLTTPAIDGWTFWQYTNRGRLRGYSGEEKYIDLNVFCGSEAEFEKYGR